METMMGGFSFFLSLLTLMLFVSQANSHEIQKFLSCFSEQSTSSKTLVTYTPENASFASILNLHIRNKRFKTAKIPKPLAIVTANCDEQVQATVKCAKSNGIHIRIRSGGHDYEGLSYVSIVPYVILDMYNLKNVSIDIENATAWVQAGATLGQIYYDIAQKSDVHAFPAGVCFSLGAGGHFSGGGYGNLLRKYGLSIDNIIDAKLVDAKGDVLDRKSMGEDLFWAIRGGGGASFGVILAWKIKLVSVPPQVTVFNIKKSVKENATDDAVYKWQLVAPTLDNDLFIRVQHDVVNGTVVVSFIGQFLGTIEKLIPLVSKEFPELDLKQSDCIEMPWVNTTLYWYGLPLGTPIKALLPTTEEPSLMYFKGRSDYVKKPIPKEALKSIWDSMVEVNNMFMQWNPYGGMMDMIPPTATPFPHRKGNLFVIQYYVFWTEDGRQADSRYTKASRSFYEFMTPHVSSNPREAFLNYRDIEVGFRHPNDGSIFDTCPNDESILNTCPNDRSILDRARTYGSKFFKENFDRLVEIKTMVDPDDFFNYEQSIPPFSH